ncbi:hypothetical protein M8J75_012261 [Diaphorina citri]|nr:hypothetical protein M8J75_012261 [Diaphorina citri]
MLTNKPTTVEPTPVEGQTPVQDQTLEHGFQTLFTKASKCLTMYYNNYLKEFVLLEPNNIVRTFDKNGREKGSYQLNGHFENKVEITKMNQKGSHQFGEFGNKMEFEIGSHQMNVDFENKMDFELTKMNQNECHQGNGEFRSEEEIEITKMNHKGSHQMNGEFGNKMEYEKESHQVNAEFGNKLHFKITKLIYMDCHQRYIFYGASGAFVTDTEFKILQLLPVGTLLSVGAQIQPIGRSDGAQIQNMGGRSGVQIPPIGRSVGEQIPTIGRTDGTQIPTIGSAGAQIQTILLDNEIIPNIVYIVFDSTIEVYSARFRLMTSVNILSGEPIQGCELCCRKHLVCSFNEKIGLVSVKRNRIVAMRNNVDGVKLSALVKYKTLDLIFTGDEKGLLTAWDHDLKVVFKVQINETAVKKLIPNFSQTSVVVLSVDNVVVFNVKNQTVAQTISCKDVEDVVLNEPEDMVIQTPHQIRVMKMMTVYNSLTHLNKPVALMATNRELIVCATDGELLTMSNRGKHIDSVKIDEEILQVCFLPGKMLVLTSNREILMIGNCSTHGDLFCNVKNVTCVHSNGDFVFTGDANGILRVLNEFGDLVYALKAHNDSISLIQVNGDQHRTKYALSSTKNEVHIWRINLEDKKLDLLKTLPLENIKNCKFLNSNICYLDDNFGMYNFEYDFPYEICTQTGRSIYGFDVFHSICATMGNDGTIRLWNTHARVIKVLNIHIRPDHMSFLGCHGDIVFTSSSELFKISHTTYWGEAIDPMRPLSEQDFKEVSPDVFKDDEEFPKNSSANDLIHPDLKYQVKLEIFLFHQNKQLQEITDRNARMMNILRGSKGMKGTTKIKDKNAAKALKNSGGKPESREPSENQDGKKRKFVTRNKTLGVVPNSVICKILGIDFAMLMVEQDETEVEKEFLEVQKMEQSKKKENGDLQRTNSKTKENEIKVNHAIEKFKISKLSEKNLPNDITESVTKEELENETQIQFENNSKNDADVILKTDSLEEKTGSCQNESIKHNEIRISTVHTQTGKGTQKKLKFAPKSIFTICNLHVTNQTSHSKGLNKLPSTRRKSHSKESKNLPSAVNKPSENKLAITQSKTHQANKKLIGQTKSLFKTKPFTRKIATSQRKHNAKDDSKVSKVIRGNSKDNVTPTTGANPNRNAPKRLFKTTKNIPQKAAPKNVFKTADNHIVAKIFRSRIQNLEIEEQEIVSMLTSVDLKTSKEMISIFVTTYSDNIRYENMVHKMAALLVESCREGFQIVILLTLVKRSRILSDSILILLLSAMITNPTLKTVIFKGLLSLGLQDGSGILLSFVSEVGSVKRRDSEKLRRNLREWLNGWKSHFEKTVVSIIARLREEQSLSFQVDDFVLRMIETVAEKKYLAQSQLLNIELTRVPTNLELEDFTKEDVTSRNLTNVVVTLLGDVLETAAFELKPVEILNYFVEVVGTAGTKRANGYNSLDAFEKYGADRYQSGPRCVPNSARSHVLTLQL